MSIEKYSDEYIKATEIIINRLVEDTCCSIINDGMHEMFFGMRNSNVKLKRNSSGQTLVVEQVFMLFGKSSIVLPESVTQYILNRVFSFDKEILQQLTGCKLTVNQHCQSQLLTASISEAPAIKFYLQGTHFYDYVTTKISHFLTDISTKIHLVWYPIVSMISNNERLSGSVIEQRTTRSGEYCMKREFIALPFDPFEHTSINDLDNSNPAVFHLAAVKRMLKGVTVKTKLTVTLTKGDEVIGVREDEVECTYFILRNHTRYKYLINELSKELFQLARNANPKSVKKAEPSVALLDEESMFWGVLSL